MIADRWHLAWTEDDSQIQPRSWRDWSLCGFLFAVAGLEATIGTRGTPLAWRVITVAATVVVVGVLPWRRSNPHLALGALWGFQLVAVVAAWQPADPIYIVGPAALVSTSVTIYALVRRSALLKSGLAAASGPIGQAIVTPATAEFQGVQDVLVTIGFWLLPGVFGLAMRWRTYGQNQKFEQTRSVERERLAREIHDSVAHHVSAISVQAQAGRTLAGEQEGPAIDALRDIEMTASQTLAEMRTMVVALRDGAASLSPRAGVENIAELESISGEVDVDFTVAGDLGQLSPVVDAALYRLAQEAITNVIKHARNASAIRVKVAADEGSVRLTVRDDGDSSSLPVGVDGLGLVGMRERASLLGGTFSAGPSSHGGWVVEADLPRSSEDA